MKVLRRKILLDDLKRFDDGVSYDTITATSIYMKVEMTQTIDDLGMVTNLPYIDGDVCENFFGFLTTTNITCHNPTSGNPPPPIGAISTYVNGGEPPYTYEWSNGETNASISNLAPGNYSVTVTDANACQITLNDEVLVFENANPTITVTLNRDYYIPGGGSQVGQFIEAGQPIPMSIFNASNIDLTVCAGEEVTLTSSEGGSYLWSNGETTQSITINSNDNYNVTVTDSNGCTGDEAITVDGIPTDTPPPLVIGALNAPPLKPDGSPQGDGSPNNPIVACLTINNPQYIQVGVIGNTNPIGDYANFLWGSGSANHTQIYYSDSACWTFQYGYACFPQEIGGPTFITDEFCVTYIEGGPDC